MSRRRTTKWLLAQGDRLTRPTVGVTILLYHRVGGATTSDVDLDVGVFRAQMRRLASGQRVIGLDDAVSILDNDQPPTDADGSAVVVTFDDGTADFCDHAVPELVDARVPATLFLATSFIDAGTPFPGGAPPSSWSGLRDAMSTGLVTIGSHTHTHALADRADVEQFSDDLQRSIDLIGEHLDTTPTHFAYPKALPGNAATERLVRERFRSAALAGNRVNTPGRTDLHRLGRTPIQRSDGMDFFARKANGGLRLEGAARELVARVKYRNATC